MAKKSISKAYVFTVALLVCIAVSGVVFGIIMPAYYSSGSKVINLSRISTNLKSSDGQSHSLSADISVKFDKRVKGVNQENLLTQVISIITGLAYEKVTGNDGISYVQDEIEKALLNYYADQDVQNVYVTALISDGSLPEEPGSNINSTLKGLFKNIK